MLERDVTTEHQAVEGERGRGGRNGSERTDI